MPDAEAPPKSQKDDIFYQALVNGWLATKLERDKSLLTLSAGGIALLVTLLTTVGPSSLIMISLYGAATLCFALSLICILWVFGRNASHLEKVAKGTESEDNTLKALDKTSLIGFLCGAALLAALGILAGLDKVTQRTGATMSKEQQSGKTTEPAPVIMKKSFEGIANMKPQPSQQGTAPDNSPQSNQPVPETPKASGSGNPTSAKSGR